LLLHHIYLHTHGQGDDGHRHPVEALHEPYEEAGVQVMRSDRRRGLNPRGVGQQRDFRHSHCHIHYVEVLVEVVDDVFRGRTGDKGDAGQIQGFR